MPTGQIKNIVRDRGFGFIQETGTSEEIFFHSSALPAGVFDQLKEGQHVEFEKGPDPRDPHRMRAANVLVEQAS